MNFNFIRVAWFSKRINISILEKISPSQFFLKHLQSFLNLLNTKAHPLSPSSDDLKYVYLTLDASSTVVVIAAVIVVVVVVVVVVVALFVVVVVTNIDNNVKVAKQSLFKKSISALDLPYVLVSVTVNDSENFCWQFWTCRDLEYFSFQRNSSHCHTS